MRLLTLLPAVLWACAPPPYVPGVEVTYTVEADVPHRPWVERSVEAVFRLLYRVPVHAVPAGEFRVVRAGDDGCEGQMGRVDFSDPRTIKICRAGWWSPATARFATVHELTHSLGFWQHLPCEVGGVMSPDYGCWHGTAPEEYTPADLEALRDAGVGQ